MAAGLNVVSAPIVGAAIGGTPLVGIALGATELWAAQSGPASIADTVKYTGSASTHPIGYPACEAGDRLLMFLGIDGSATSTTPADGSWTELQNVQSNTTVTLRLFEYVATEDRSAGTVDVTLGQSRRLGSVCHRISGAQAVEVGWTGGGVASGGIDFGAATPSWGGGEQTLFIVGAAVDGGKAFATAPDGWPEPTQANEGGASVGTSHIYSTDASVDPVGGGISGFDGWNGLHLAVRSV